MPDSALILSDLAKVELAQADTSLLPSAIAHLEKANSLDNTNPTTWRLLATAYGSAGNSGMSALALAEEAELEDDPKQALTQVNVALSALKDGSTARQRAQDVKARALDMRREQKEDRSSF
jgi:predicted Zn-dependent protease